MDNGTKANKYYKDFMAKEPIQESNIIKEDINSFIIKFRRLYYTGRRLTFKEWLGTVEDLLDELT